MGHSASPATAILSDFSSKVQPLRFRLRDESGGRFELQADVYLLNDMLNKDKFFLAMKFTDLDRKVWIRTRVSMSTQTIYENMNPVLREWLLVEKAIDISMPSGSVQADRLKDLLKYRAGSALPTSLHLTPHEEHVVELIIAKVLYFFQHKYCLSEKISGQVLAAKTTALKKMATLNSYFHEKHAPKLPGLWKSILRIPPLPWELLQKLDKEFVADEDIKPVGIRFGPMFDPFEAPRVSNLEDADLLDDYNPTAQTLTDPVDLPPAEITGSTDWPAIGTRPSAMRKPRLSIPETAKVFIRLKQSQRRYHGWQQARSAAEDCVRQVKSHLLTVVIKARKLFWLNTVAIGVKDRQDPSNDILEDFEVKLIQTHFPFKTDKQWIGSGGIKDMPKALNLNRKTLLGFLGSRLGGRRVFEHQVDKMRQHISDFIGRPR